VATHAAAVAVVSFIWIAFEDPIATLVVGGSLCFVVYLGLGIVEMKRAPLGFSPLSLYFLWYSVGLGLSAIYVASVLSTESISPSFACLSNYTTCSIAFSLQLASRNHPAKQLRDDFRRRVQQHKQGPS
jgi:hypothetical protein